MLLLAAILAFRPDFDPVTFLGGRILLPKTIFEPLISLSLFYAAFRLNRLQPKDGDLKSIRATPLWAALSAGAAMGQLSGLAGIGGGILQARCSCSWGGLMPARLPALRRHLI